MCCLDEGQNTERGRRAENVCRSGEPGISLNPKLCQVQHNVRPSKQPFLCSATSDAVFAGADRTSSQCLHLSGDLCRPPQAALCNTPLLCTRGQWERVTSCGTTAGLRQRVSIDVQACIYVTEGARLVRMWGSLGCFVSVGIKYACDITAASAAT